MFKRYLNLILLFFLVMFWGGSFIAIKFAILAWPPFFAAGLRVLTSLITMIIFILALNKRIHIAFHLRWRVWILGIFALGIPFTSLFWGERFIAPGLAGILNATTLIWTFLLSLLLFSRDKNLQPKKIFGVILGFVGILIIFWPMLSFGETKWEFFGGIAVLIMAISYAIAGVLAQWFFAKYGKLDLYTNLYHQCWAAFIFIMLFSTIFEKWPSWHSLSISYYAIWGTLYLGVFSTAVSWLIYYHLIREWGAIRASIASYLIPIAALFDDYIIFHNVPRFTEIIGICVILFAIFMISSYRKT